MSLKPIIKSAREALDRKDYAYALQLCTDALAFEPENYWLLVFKAVALGGEGKSELALSEYSKAARVQTDNPTAFQVNRIKMIHCSLFRVSSICTNRKTWNLMKDTILPWRVLIQFYTPSN